MIELKQTYLVAMADAGLRDDPSYEEISRADELVPDEAVFEHYAGIDFVKDDFFCNAEERTKERPWDYK